VNKKVLEITSLHTNNSQNYWKNKTYLERLAALEELRKIAFGYDPSTIRIQKTITVTVLKKNKKASGRLQDLADLENLEK